MQLSPSSLIRERDKERKREGERESEKAKEGERVTGALAPFLVI
jgi:hypothetical protein